MRAVREHVLSPNGSNMVCYDPRHGWLAHAVKTRHLSTRFSSRHDAFGDLTPFGGIEFLAPPANSPLRPCCGETSRSPLADHGTFILGECPNHLHHHPPRWSGRVDILGD